MADYNASLPVRSEADVDERLQSKIVDYSTPSQGLSVDAQGRAHVGLKDASGVELGTEDNPVFVAQTESPGTEVHNYNTGAAVAANASSTHTYTVSGTDFELHQVFASGSGKMKIEIKVGPASSEVTRFVGFNSVANPNIIYSLSKSVLVPVGQNVLVVRTNLDNQAQDLYSTVVGLLKV